MKYFTKYLKAESIATVNGCNQCEIGGIIKIREDNYKYIGNNKFEEVKLFLCSRICYRERDSFYYENYPNIPKDQFKVIGEISKDAIWVKEEMELDDEEINRQFYDDSGSSESCWFDYNRLHTEEDWAEIPENWKRIQIKCPTCKTFH